MTDRDVLAEMLERNCAPKLEILLALSPDEPLAEIEFDWSATPREREKIQREVDALAARFLGFQADYCKRESMKYGALPRDDAPLAEYVRARVGHAKALWSRAVEAGWTRLQFSAWLALHIDWQTEIPPLWPDQPRWREALELLRLAHGMPRLPPTTLNPAPRAAPEWAFHPRHIRMMSGARR